MVCSVQRRTDNNPCRGASFAGDEWFVLAYRQVLRSASVMGDEPERRGLAVLGDDLDLSVALLVRRTQPLEESQL